MAPSVSRHTQVRATEIKTITAADALRIFANRAIQRNALSYLMQQGSAYLGTTRYISFPTAFGDTPALAISPLGSFDMAADAPISGSSYQYGLHSISAGSFQSYATPSQYYLWTAIGSA